MYIQVFEYIETFFLLLVRITGIFTSAPVIGAESLPAQIRIMTALVLSMLLMPAEISSRGAVKIPPQTYIFALIVVKEILLGLLLGFVASFVIEGVKLAGELMGIQIGFAMVSVIDPESQQEESITGSFNYLIFTLIFLMINGHHLIIEALNQSLRIVPLGLVYYNGNFVSEIFDRAPEFFTIGVKIAAPIVVPLIMLSVVLGIISRAVPRLEVFLISFPLNILVSFMIIIYYMDDLVKYFIYLIHSNIFDELIRILYLLK
ncbi:MAG: Flagellar biosynthetic protein FliR [bacterium ADurb.Bin243]|nr:MAG: Flagellar biosynthetic protein FliR [bacterium ADurb.Bin243]